MEKAQSGLVVERLVVGGGAIDCQNWLAGTETGPALCTHIKRPEMPIKRTSMPGNAHRLIGLVLTAIAFPSAEPANRGAGFKGGLLGAMIVATVELLAGSLLGALVRNLVLEGRRKILENQEAMMSRKKESRILKTLDDLNTTEAHVLLVALDKKAQTIYLDKDANEVHSLIDKGLLESVPDESTLSHKPFRIPKFVWDQLQQREVVQSLKTNDATRS